MGACLQFQSMIIMVGNTAASRKAERWSSSWELCVLMQRRRERETLGLGWAVETSEDTPPNPSKQFINGGLGMQIYRHMGDILLQTTTLCDSQHLECAHEQQCGPSRGWCIPFPTVHIGISQAPLGWKGATFLWIIHSQPLSAASLTPSWQA